MRYWLTLLGYAAFVLLALYGSLVLVMLMGGAS